MHELSHQLEHGAMPRLSGYERRYLESALQFFPRTQAEALAWSGVTWDYGVGDFTATGASSLWGGLPDMVANTTHTAVGTPFAGKTSAETTSGGAGNWHLPNNSDLDPGTSELAIYGIVRCRTGASGSRLLNKYLSGDGIQIDFGNGTQLVARANDTTANNFTATISATHEGVGYFPFYFHVKADDFLDLRTHLGSASTPTTGMGSLSVATFLRMPGNGAVSPALSPLLLLASIGANAAGIDGADLIARTWRGA